MAPLTATFGTETDHLLAIVERMQQAGRSEREINSVIARSFRPAGRSWAARAGAAGRRLLSRSSDGGSTGRRATA